MLKAAFAVDGIRGLSQWGIPASAVIGEVWGEILPVSNWDSMVRPTRGGIEIATFNRTKMPTNPDSSQNIEEGSLGFNVRTPAGVEYLLTASHIANTYSGTNGSLGDTILQPSIGSCASVSRTDRAEL